MFVFSAAAEREPWLEGGIGVSGIVVVLTVVTIIANAGSGVATLIRPRPVRELMTSVHVPDSWITTLGVLKLAGAVGLLLGLLGVPVIGVAAAIGLIAFFVCAIFSHLLARALGFQFGLAIVFLALAVGTLAVHLVSVPGVGLAVAAVW